jgi:hypothetical protein
MSTVIECSSPALFLSNSSSKPAHNHIHFYLQHCIIYQQKGTEQWMEGGSDHGKIRFHRQYTIPQQI